MSSHPIIGYGWRNCKRTMDTQGDIQKKDLIKGYLKQLDKTDIKVNKISFAEVYGLFIAAIHT